MFVPLDIPVMKIMKNNFEAIYKQAVLYSKRADTNIFRFAKDQLKLECQNEVVLE